MTINTFSPAYANAILIQKKEGTICAICGFTEVEHCFEADKCCHKRDKPSDEELEKQVAERLRAGEPQ